jgi:hypothetical protein
VAFSKAVAACSSSSRRARAARARRRAATAFSSDSSVFLYEGVEFGFEGCGVGGDVAWFGTHAGVGFENLAASASGRRLVAAAAAWW